MVLPGYKNLLPPDVDLLMFDFRFADYKLGKVIITRMTIRASDRGMQMRSNLYLFWGCKPDVENCQDVMNGVRDFDTFFAAPMRLILVNDKNRNALRQLLSRTYPLEADTAEEIVNGYGFSLKGAAFDAWWIDNSLGPIQKYRPQTVINMRPE